MMRTLIALAAVVVLCATVGTAVYAMVEADDPPRAVATRQTADEAPGGGGSSVAAICAIDVPDCDDTIEGDGGFAQCATEEPCGDFDYTKCAADAAAECYQPGVASGIGCPDGASIEECFPDGVPAGYECVTLESFPVQTRCYSIDCPTVDGPVTILPAPVPDETVVVVDPALVDPAVDPAAPNIACLPGYGEDCYEDEGGALICVPIDCAMQDVIVEGCLGTDPCTISSRINARCLPPDCAVSSDGAIDCPVPLPVPCIDRTDDVPDADLKPCEVPGSPGVCVGGPAVDCGPVCLDDTDLTPEECARIDPPVQSGSGSDGSTGAEPVE